MSAYLFCWQSASFGIQNCWRFEINKICNKKIKCYTYLSFPFVKTYTECSFQSTFSSMFCSVLQPSFLVMVRRQYSLCSLCTRTLTYHCNTSLGLLCKPSFIPTVASRFFCLGADGQSTLLLCIPSFATSHSCVLVNLKDLSCTPLSVDVNMFSDEVVTSTGDAEEVEAMDEEWRLGNTMSFS